MSFSRPFQWYHSHADPIWPDGTFKMFLKIYVKFIHAAFRASSLDSETKIQFSTCQVINKCGSEQP